MTETTLSCALSWAKIKEGNKKPMTLRSGFCVPLCVALRAFIDIASSPTRVGPPAGGSLSWNKKKTTVIETKTISFHPFITKSVEY
ncbi:hypothetical protein COT63_00620 [Candidatus Shapirobacteria bacterium CG09_land_8_20_14_0_10_38_17]|uniref:Uncharacterized protein n=1 Tax=Candidatus Shapirobacteria bacterium CG09_land_8_20_14_0_10_38_17 TaxID=1974884 RepID=A0A2H0WRN0_9BACT|nr:MAG: hypothetical protein COT63_00620 [Candidatus Shapirobacteria bacterium CG09_land_8_20_14_0_10_38_17]